MIELLTQHTYIENEVMYPRVRELLPELEDDVLESYEEHHVADVLNAPTRPSQPSALKKTTDAVISQRLRVSTSGCRRRQRATCSEEQVARCAVRIVSAGRGSS